MFDDPCFQVHLQINYVLLFKQWIVQVKQKIELLNSSIMAYNPRPHMMPGVTMVTGPPFTIGGEFILISNILI